MRNERRNDSDPFGTHPTGIVRTQDDLTAYNRSGWVQSFSEGTAGWTAPDNMLVGNQVAVSYRQTNIYEPLIAEIIGGDGDNEIHANSRAMEFVDGGQDRTVRDVGRRSDARESRRWRNGDPRTVVSNDTTWRTAA